MNYPLSETLIMLAEMEIKPDRLDDFFDYTVENLKICRSQPGNIVFDIWFNEAQPTKVIFYEVWDSAEAQQAYMAWRVERGDLKTLLSFVSGTPHFTPLRSIAAA